MAHLYVGTSVPGGAPGQYPYHINGEGSDAIWEEIDVTDLEGPIYVAMHFEAENPEANQNETAWAKGEGPRVSGWGWTIIFDQDDDSCTNDDDDSYNGDTEGDGGSGSYGDDAGGGSYGGNDGGTGGYPDGGDYGI